MGKRYWLIDVTGCTDPYVRGPYATSEEQDEAARKIRKEQDEEDALFWATTGPTGQLRVGSYQHGFFEDENWGKKGDGNVR